MARSAARLVTNPLSSSPLASHFEWAQTNANKHQRAPNKPTPAAAKPTEVTRVSPRHNWPPAASTSTTTSHSHDAQPTGRLPPRARTPKKEVKREEKREDRVQRGKRRGQGPPPSKPNTPPCPLTPQRQRNTPGAPHPRQRRTRRRRRCRCANANGQAPPPAPTPAPAAPQRRTTRLQKRTACAVQNDDEVVVVVPVHPLTHRRPVPHPRAPCSGQGWLNKWRQQEQGQGWQQEQREWVWEQQQRQQRPTTWPSPPSPPF
jgi:hypothetical protein